MNRLEQIIQKSNVIIRRDFERESSWRYIDYEQKVEEALNYHCPNFICSDLLKTQLSQLYHQSYVVINNTAIAVPVSSILRSLENIDPVKKGRGKLTNISKHLGFDVFHVHFGQSSFITENWFNYANRNNLKDKPLTIENVYQSLVDSLSSKYRTGEWIVYSKNGGKITIWCLWLHGAGDAELVSEIEART